MQGKEFFMYYTNRESNPITLNNLIAELEAATGADMSAQDMKHRIWAAIIPFSTAFAVF